MQSRPALSLLAYCYYQTRDYVNAADCYEQLALICDDCDQYKYYYALSLYKADLFEEAMKVSCQIENPLYASQVCLKTEVVDCVL